MFQLFGVIRGFPQATDENRRAAHNALVDGAYSPHGEARKARRSQTPAPGASNRGVAANSSRFVPNGYAELDEQ